MNLEFFNRFHSFSSPQTTRPNPAPAPQPAPVLPSSSSAPDRVSVPGLPSGSVPAYSFLPGQLQNQGQQLEHLLQQADQKTLSRYGMGLNRDADGRLLGFTVQGQPVSYEQARQCLAGYQSQIRTELGQSQQQVDTEYRSFVSLANSLYSQLSQSEQTSVKIMLQTINVLYTSFAQRLSQINALAQAKGAWF